MSRKDDGPRPPRAPRAKLPATDARADETFTRSRFGPISAAVVVAALVAPFALWGNPYPAPLLAYWGLGTVAALAVAAALYRWYDTAVQPAADWVGRLSPAQFTLLVGAATTLASGALAIYAFHRFATTSDEIAQLWHARILLSGHWSLPVDPNREFFSLDTVVDSGRWYSQFPIGGPIVLALGAAVGAPWIVNPILAGVATAAVYRFARRAYGDAAARRAALLFAAAPMVLLMAGTWMNHVPTMLLATIALAATAAWDDAEPGRGGYRWAAAIGLAVGGMAAIRPLDAVVAAVVLGGFQLWRVAAAPRRIPELAIEIAAGGCCIGLLLFANWKTAGAALRFGYDVAWGPGHRVGFHLDPYGTPHTLARGLDYALTYFGELNVDLTAWPIPVLVVLAAGFAVMRRPRRWDVLLAALVAAQTLAYGAYWYRGELLGPRFLYTVAPAVVILVSLVPTLVAGRFAERFGVRAGRAATAALLGCVLVAWAAPTSTVGARGIAAQVRGQRRSLKIDLAGAVRDAGVHHALVFLREPFSQRLARRLWALGVGRAEAPRLIDTRDACVLLAAIDRAERDSAASPAERAAIVRSVPPVVNPQGTVALDPSIHVQSRATLTPACESEIDGDTGRSPVPFGVGLVLEPIGPGGRIDGDVIYAADLGAHDEVLRARFGDRRWFRVRLDATPSGLRPVLEPY